MTVPAGVGGRPAVDIHAPTRPRAGTGGIFASAAGGTAPGYLPRSGGFTGVEDFTGSGGVGLAA